MGLAQALWHRWERIIYQLESVANISYTVLWRSLWPPLTLFVRGSFNDHPYLISIHFYEDTRRKYRTYIQHLKKKYLSKICVTSWALNTSWIVLRSLSWRFCSNHLVYCTSTSQRSSLDLGWLFISLSRWSHPASIIFMSGLYWVHHCLRSVTFQIWFHYISNTLGLLSC